MTSPYRVLTELADESRALQTPERREYLWRNVARLESALRAQLILLGESIYLEAVTIYVDDPFYRQGATVVLLDFRFDADDPFKVGVTCVVDHSQIGVRVVSAPVNPKYERIRSLVEPASSNGPDLPLDRLGAH